MMYTGEIVRPMDRRIKLIALDMDGTLLTDGKSIRPDTAADIAWAASRGVHVVYGSGRSYAELSPYTASLPQMRYAVCASGSAVYDLREKRCIYAETIPIETVRAIIETAGEDAGMFNFLTDSELIIRKKDLPYMKDFQMGVYQSLYERVGRTVDSMLQECASHDGIGKVNIYFRNKPDREHYLALLQHLPVTFVRSEETSLEMTSPGVSKAKGLRALASHLGVAMEETAAVGDSMNDLTMLREAGVAVAMGNAGKEVKAVCRFETDDNNHNGAGKAIRRLLSENY